MVRLFRCSSILSTVSLPLVLLPLLCNAGGGTLSLQKTAPFDTLLSVPDAVKDNCELETKVIDFVASCARDDFDRIALVDSASASTPGKALAVRIIDVTSTGGGAWSGPKHLSIEGTLWQDGKVIGTFTAVRVIGGGAWGAYKGTCSLLERCAKTLGRDVAGWLQSPSMDAKLGDVR
jgi:hypothetical protein